MKVKKNIEKIDLKQFENWGTSGRFFPVGMISEIDIMLIKKVNEIIEKINGDSTTPTLTSGKGGIVGVQMKRRQE
tara:strand:- start:147 stop:371 length:225 start_codon:yes stop_codon:yes gene_type:complete